MTSYIQLEEKKEPLLEAETHIHQLNGISHSNGFPNKYQTATPALSLKALKSLQPQPRSLSSSSSSSSSNPPNPEYSTNLLYYLTYGWLSPLIQLGSRHPLLDADLFAVRPDYVAKLASHDFQIEWVKEMNRARAAGNPSAASLIRPFRHIYGTRYGLAFIAKVICDGMSFIQPMLLQLLLSSLATRTVEFCLVVCFGMFVAGVCSTLAGSLHWRTTMMTGIQARNCLITAIYSKSLRLSPKARQEKSTGMIVNLMSTDTSKIDMAIGWVQAFPACIIQIIIAVALLLNTIGVSALAGIAVIVFLIPIQGRIVGILQGIRKKAVVFTDRRVKMTNEILQGIKVIKLYGWEIPFMQKLTQIRIDEMALVRKGIYIRAINVTMAQFGPIFMSLIAFIVLAAQGGDLTPQNVFSSLVLFNLLRFPLMQLPFVGAMIADSIVSLNRIQSFLLSDEIQDQPQLTKDPEYAVIIEKGEFSWETVKQDMDETGEDGKGKGKGKTKGNKLWKGLLKGAKNTEGTERLLFSSAASSSSDSLPSPSSVPSALRDVNIRLKHRGLTAIVGSVGAGKSSLLSGILGEMKRRNGHVAIAGTVSYCHQQAWIQNASLRNNILFGLPFDEQRYREVIRVCELERDLEILPAGDQTEIGEKGITLSGGQKQRVSLARAVYFNADILLLDDIFSALDMHVGASIFKKCILGTLKNKTRLLVTHQLQYCQFADHIIFIQNGQIVEQGSFQQLTADGKDFATLIKNYGGGQNEEEAEDSLDKATAALEEETKSNHDKALHRPGLRRATSEASSDEALLLAAKKKKVGELMSVEERAVGNIPWAVYKYYFQSLGGKFTLFLLLVLLVLGTVSKVLTDAWLAVWSDATDGDPNYYMLIYALLGVSQCFSVFLLAFFVAKVSTSGAVRLHDKSFSSVMRAPLSFTETTPLGRIIHRFSKDQDTIDTSLSESLRSVALLGSIIVGSLIMMCIATPFLILPLVPCLLIYYRIQLSFRRTSREVKRMDSISRSPLFAHFSETLTGLSTIRAYQRQQHFIKGNEDRVDVNMRAYYLTVVLQRWIGLRLESLGSLIIFFAGAVITITSIYFELQPGLAGLSLSYAMSMTTSLVFMIRQSIEAEMAMNSVERSKYYAEGIAQEKAAVLAEDRTLVGSHPTNKSPWPTKGYIKFDRVSMRYRPNLPLILENVTVEINGGERVGIVGRTGAGKSSLLSCLFRLVENSDGHIIIDDVPIDRIGLSTLRQSLSIIPQDAVLFSGSIRSNLDPFNDHSDAQIWSVLEKAHLKATVSRLEHKLESPVSEGGENFSQGEKCQLCLARAMLKEAKILVMDEATASIDLETDSLIQQSLHQEFHCTILTIAHRLLTVIDYDRIMVIDAGKIVEYDAPHLLLEKPTGHFKALVEETGDANQLLLTQLAKEAFYKKTSTATENQSTNNL